MNWGVKGPDTCTIRFADRITFAEAHSQCQAMGGHLPILTSSAENDKTDNWVWLGLFTDDATVDNCDSVVGCIATGKSFYWDGGNALGKIPLSSDVTSFMNRFEIKQQSKCMRKAFGTPVDDPCDSLNRGHCVMHLDQPIEGGNALPPDFNFDSFACKSPLTPPSDSNLALPSNLPEFTCIGNEFTYNCDAGGVNVRMVSRINCTFSTLSDFLSPWQSYKFLCYFV